MKKIAGFITLLFLCFIFAGCASSDLSDEFDIDVPFEGTVDTRFGYEGYYWGMHLDDIKNMKNYPFVSDYYNGTKRYFYGEKKYDTYFHSSHGIVYQTDFYFSNDRLYKAVDKLKKKNIPLEELHKRYGDFSEENIVSEFNNKAYTAIYSNRNLYENDKLYSLLIAYRKDGSVEVNMYDAYANYSLKDKKLKDYLFDLTDAPKNKWVLFGCTDGQNKVYDIIAKYENNEGKSIILFYDKNPDAAIQSSLRIGFQTGIESMGSYEIKTKDWTREMYLDSYSRRYSVIDYGPSITDNANFTVRQFLEMLTENEEISIKYYSDIYKFNISGFEKALNDFGLTIDELFAAVENEEF